MKAGIVSQARMLCQVKVSMQRKKMVTHCIDSAGAWCAAQRHALRDTMPPVWTARRLRMCYLWQY